MLALYLNAFRFLKAIIRSWSGPKFRGALVLAIVLLLSGTVFYKSIEDWSWIDSLYFCVTTVTTVGAGDLSPKTDIGKLFTVLYIFVGVGIFVALLAQFAKALLSDYDDEAADAK